jgi:protein-tyrosine phosphatase
MFGFFNKKKTTTENVLQHIKCDMHSHILPGIDDGAPDVEASLKLINTLVEKGCQKIICTPHIYKDLYPNTNETIKKSYQTLLPFVQEKFPQIKLQYAAEYFMDDHFDHLLSNNEKLLTVHEKWVLVEHSFLQPPQDLKDKLFNLQMAGYTPILAHPERYEFYTKNVKAYDDLYDIGCIFQLNLLSLNGYYGKIAKELAKHLVEKKYVRLLGTDMHHERHQLAIEQFENNKIVQDLFQQDRLLNISLL